MTTKNKMAEIISVMNQKGGAGKTTGCQHTSIAMACKGKRVLFIDLDPQLTGYKFFVKNHNQFPQGYDGVIDVLSLKVEHLKATLDQHRQNYDYIFLDTKPALGAEMSDIIGLSNLVIIACQPSYKDTDATKGIVDSIKANQRLNPNIKAKVLISRKDPRQNIQLALNDFAEMQIEPFKTHIREYKTCYDLAERSGTGIIHMDAKDNADKAAQDIHQFTNELINYLAA